MFTSAKDLLPCLKFFYLFFFSPYLTTVLPKTGNTVPHQFRLGSLLIMKNVLNLWDVLPRDELNLLCYEMKLLKHFK